MRTRAGSSTLYLPVGDNGRLKKVHFLLVTLSHSRKIYVEAVLSQNTEIFLRSLENSGITLELQTWDAESD